MCLGGKEGFLEHVREYKGISIVCQNCCPLTKGFQYTVVCCLVGLRFFVFKLEVKYNEAFEKLIIL